MKKLVCLTLVLTLILSMGMISAGSADESTLNPVTLKFIFFADKKSATDEVWAAIADEYRDQLNADFDVQFIPSDDYRDKLMLKASAGESWDMNFEGNWLGYYQMIAMDAYMDLTELLPEYAPDLYAAYQESGALSAATYNDKIVCLPWTMTMNNRTNFMWRGDLAEQAGITVDKDNLTDFDAVYEVLLQLKEAYPDRYAIESASLDAMRVKYNLADIGNSLVIDFNDPEYKVQPIETTDAYREYAQFAEKLQKNGLIWADVLNDVTDHNSLINQGKLITKWGTNEYARTQRAWAEEGAYWDYAFLYQDGLSANRTSLANVAAIPITAENPERTLMFMNLLETDQKLYDMMHYGILGVTYVLNGEEAAYPEGMDQSSSNYMDWQGRWAYWKPQFMRPDSLYAKDFWKEEAEYAANTPNNIVSPFDGFSFNSDSVSVEVAQREQVYRDANRVIEVGLAGDADAAVDKMIADQSYNAEIIVAEAQRQIDEYMNK